MPISKLSAPQPHELVRKVNELVDAVNSGGGGGECNLKAVVIKTPLSDLMDYDSESGVYINSARVYLSDLGENDLAGGVLVDYFFVFPDEEGNPSSDFYSIGGFLDPFIKDGTLIYQKSFVLIDDEYIDLFNLNSTDEEFQNLLVNEFFPYCYLGILYKVGGFDDVVDYFGGGEDE